MGEKWAIRSQVLSLSQDMDAVHRLDVGGRGLKFKRDIRFIILKLYLRVTTSNRLLFRQPAGSFMTSFVCNAVIDGGA